MAFVLRRSTACYRITSTRLQYIAACTRVANSTWRGIVETFASIEPLLNVGVEEMRILAVDGKFWAWSIWLPEEHAVRLSGLTRQALLVALGRINEKVAELNQRASGKARVAKRR